MTLSDKKEYRQTALAAGLQRCSVVGIGNIEGDIPGLQGIPLANKAARVKLIKDYIDSGKWPKSIDQRELRPGPAADLGATATAIDSWLTGALAVVGTAYGCFQGPALTAVQLVAGKLLVCYGVSIDSAAVPLPVSRLTFLKGTNVQGIFDMEPLMIRWEVDAFLSEPMVFDPQEAFSIDVRCRNATRVAEIVHIHNFLFESAGQVIA